jgi:threonyl-tRNA synthetase
LVAGDKEVESETVAVRSREGQDLGAMTLEQFKRSLDDSIALRGRSAANAEFG